MHQSSLMRSYMNILNENLSIVEQEKKGNRAVFINFATHYRNFVSILLTDRANKQSIQDKLSSLKEFIQNIRNPNDTNEKLAHALPSFADFIKAHDFIIQLFFDYTPKEYNDFVTYNGNKNEIRNKLDNMLVDNRGKLFEEELRNLSETIQNFNLATRQHRWLDISNEVINSIQDKLWNFLKSKEWV